MKNKFYLKKYLIICIVFVIGFLVLNKIEYHVYQINYNKKINSIVNTIKNKYPLVKEEEIIKILNSKSDTDTLSKYGIDLLNDSIIEKNNDNYYLFLILNIILVIVMLFLLIKIFIVYNYKKDKEIKEIAKYLDEINHKNYSLKIDELSEDELSILKGEIYKTTIMLKETTENTLKDKKNLKTSIEDISHQIKTPLTSILIILDNLIDNPNMDKDIKTDFIHDLKREIIKINFLVQSLLKLSKFDANSIVFNNQRVSVKKLINTCQKSLANICDLRNIKINVSGNKDIYIMVDMNWQVEALTNIIKNAIEYSEDNSEIYISYNENNVYTKIEITNFGKMIEKDDIPHLFERFYKGKNASSDSVGIGLALSKRIIAQNNGTISVLSNKEKTTFIIKYFRV